MRQHSHVTMCSMQVLECLIAAVYSTYAVACLVLLRSEQSAI